MVLENISSSKEPSFSEDSPSSDLDPYASDTFSSQVSSASRVQIRVDRSLPGGDKGPQSIYIDMDKVPQILARPRSPFLKARLENYLTAINRNVQSVLERSLTQSEADALGYHFAQAIRTVSFATPIGLAAGSAFWYRGRATMRFPGFDLFTKEGMWRRDRFFGVLRGGRATLAWQALRFGAYVGINVWGARIFISSYAAAATMVHQRMDPRLKEVEEARNEYMRRANRQTQPLSDKVKAAQESRMQGTTQDETYEQMRQRRNVQERWKKSRQENKASQDDASPTGGAFGLDYGDETGGAGFMTDEQMRQQEAKQRGSENRESMDRGEFSFDAQRASSAPRSQQPSSRPQAAQEQGASGGAWDRLRQQANSGTSSAQSSRRDRQPTDAFSPWPSPDASREARQGSTLGDSFSFSSSDEEKHLAKAEAQKEFDERIAREREGRDFDGDGQGRRRW